MPNTETRPELTPEQIEDIGRKTETAKRYHAQYKELHDAAETLHLLLLRAVSNAAPKTLKDDELIERRDALLELLTKLAPISEALFVAMKCAEDESNPEQHTKRRQQHVDVAINLGELLRRAASK